MKIYSVYDMDFDQNNDAVVFKVTDDDYTVGVLTADFRLAIKMYRIWQGTIHSIGGAFVTADGEDRLHILLRYVKNNI